MVINLGDRVAIVTGAAQGIGRAIAHRLAQEGARVVVADVSAADGQQTAAAICTGGGEAIFQPTDVTDARQVADMVAAAVRRYGRLDILVNNVGVTRSRPFMEVSREEWQANLDINLTSMFLTAQQAQPHLAEHGHGAIVNIASMHALHTVPGLAAYAAAKGGVLALTRSLALEFAPRIRVNAIMPGLVETETWRQTVGDVEAARQHRLAFHPLGRLGQPEDIAGAVAFLVSDDAAFITGVALPVDGGVSAQLYRG